MSDETKPNEKASQQFLERFAWFWGFASVIYFGAVTFGNVPKDNAHFADIILGFLLGTAVATIIGYFYGASKPASPDPTTPAGE